jgi:hypothetical protein
MASALPYWRVGNGDGARWKLTAGAAQQQAILRIRSTIMKHRSLATTLLAALSLSTFLVACGSDADTRERAALERESLERDLQLALQPDTTVQPEFTDIAIEETVVEAPPPPAASAAPAPAPAPAPRRQSPAPPPRRTEPAPAPAPRAPVGPRVVQMPVPSGTTLALRMNQELSTRSTRAGDGFTASLTEAVYAADGTLLIPAGATVRGRVVESVGSARAGQTAQLRLAFESVVVDGRTYPIAATALDVPVRTVTRDGRGEQAAKIGGGAAVGAVVGRVIGKSTKATVAGAAIGAAAGTAVAMGTADVDAVVSSGARVVIRLDSTLRVEKEV